MTCPLRATPAPIHVNITRKKYREREGSHWRIIARPVLHLLKASQQLWL
jgi:hypothetical protein